MKKQKSILDFFSGNPRPAQASLLLEIERRWDEADVFVLSAPTAFGKTLTIEAIARFAMSKKKSSHILVPNNLLLEQMEKAFRVFSLKNKESYTCYTPTIVNEQSIPTSCKDHYDTLQEHCAGCPYIQAIRKVHAVPFSVSNYHTFMAHKLHKQVLLVDEAHLLLPLLSELNAKHIWLPEVHGRSLLPHYVKTYSQLQEYLTKHPELSGKVWDEIRQELDGGRERYLIERKPKPYRGTLKDCLSLIPIDIRHSEKSKAFFNPKKVEKIFLLSGTISSFDVEQMALAGKRIVYLEGQSPIEVTQRPIILEYTAPIVARDYLKLAPQLAKQIADTVQKYDGKVLVHCPYSLNALLTPLLKGLLGDRVISHTPQNKITVVEDFKTSTKPIILVGSGLEEGLDLYGDDFRLQIICKVPFPNLGEPAWNYLAKEEPKRYAWESIKKVVQAAGRICRGPEDYGKTILLDKNFERILRMYPDLLPTYFKEALCENLPIS